MQWRAMQCGGAAQAATGRAREGAAMAGTAWKSLRSSEPPCIGGGMTLVFGCWSGRQCGGRSGGTPAAGHEWRRHIESGLRCTGGTPSPLRLTAAAAAAAPSGHAAPLLLCAALPRSTLGLAARTDARAVQAGGLALLPELGRHARVFSSQQQAAADGVAPALAE